MKVKRNENGSYKIEGAMYIYIEIGYITEDKKCYELRVTNIDEPRRREDKNFYKKYRSDRIFYTEKLEELKMFLAKYETEKDLIADYYTARLEGKHELDFYRTRR